MKRKILICGSTGFIGRNIVASLTERDGFEVFGTCFNSEPLDNPKIKMIRADLRRNEEVENVVKGMDIIIQAAATTSGAKDTINKPYYHVTDNAVMNSLIFRAAHEQGVSHVVFFSCTTMYQTSDVPVKETDFDATEEMYPSYFGVAWTKVYIEKMCEFYSRLGRTKFTAIRHSNIFGPYDKYDLDRSHVFGATVTKVMTAEDGGSVMVWGAGEEERDLLYISDLVSFVELAISKQDSRYELYNVGYGSSISVNDMVKKIIENSGKNLKIEHDLSKPSIKTKLCLDITRAKNHLGWSPEVSLGEGIQKTMDWYKSHFTQEAR
ncbi:NAD-dependent epimerase/dehydratase family protein [Chloroflexota bacterium]